MPSCPQFPTRSGNIPGLYISRTLLPHVDTQQQKHDRPSSGRPVTFLHPLNSARNHRRLPLLIYNGDTTQPPLSRPIGSTFEHVFVLPMPTNPGNPRPRKPKITTPGHKQPNTTSKPKKPTQPKRPKLTPDQKKEFTRVRAAEERQRRKELGLCRECPNQTIKGQTRCPDCAKKHSQAQKRQSNPAETPKGPIQVSHIVLGTEGPTKKAHSQSPTKQHKPTPDSETTASVKRQEYEQRRSQRPERKEAARQAARKPLAKPQGRGGTGA